MALGGAGVMIITVLSVEVFLSALFVALRSWTRKALKAGIGIDDYVLVGTWVIITTVILNVQNLALTWFYKALQAVFVGCTIASALYGLGQHDTDVRREDRRTSIKIGITGLAVVSTAAGTGKVAVALFLMRIVVSVWHKAFLWFWIITTMVWSIFLSVSCFVQCIPVASLWDERIKTFRCPLNLAVISITACSTDFFLAAFPWVVLWRLNMRRREKVTICISLSLGVLAGICGIIRIFSIKGLSHESDYLSDTTSALIWTNSELTITLICVCIPVLRPLWVRLVGRTFPDRYSKRPNKSYGLFAVAIGRKPTKKTDTEVGLNIVSRPGVKAMHTTIVGASRRQSGTGSEQGILPENNVIKETREFTIVYEGGSSNMI
ncbi:uncharacterized protein F4822DRAFT_154594 [Hypoxylon trugodes]|uniref:uncharacterized protein n=1 Tax=Hypoxylon trugodes TaxID=326681 RepID=UPI00219FE1CE|nr:uncharacterized protein F4822DRAFT_154594 [Hypoxylon trugodes]KAI1390567.1 hypothetical protein F4822DRAFT_154594 [Hypoxylon trugodes]